LKIKLKITKSTGCIITGQESLSLFKMDKECLHFIRIYVIIIS